MDQGKRHSIVIWISGMILLVGGLFLAYALTRPQIVGEIECKSGSTDGYDGVNPDCYFKNTSTIELTNIYLGDLLDCADSPDYESVQHGEKAFSLNTGSSFPIDPAIIRDGCRHLQVVGISDQGKIEITQTSNNMSFH
ncbi:MAG: hypothetical protein GC165_07420 [Armatimonadetes bacterium]|nr:hypothetical protein [Armatimonadota bacterium]